MEKALLIGITLILIPSLFTSGSKKILEKSKEKKFLFVLPKESKGFVQSMGMR